MFLLRDLACNGLVNLLVAGKNWLRNAYVTDTKLVNLRLRRIVKWLLQCFTNRYDNAINRFLPTLTWIIIDVHVGSGNSFSYNEMKKTQMVFKEQFR